MSVINCLLQNGVEIFPIFTHTENMNQIETPSKLLIAVRSMLRPLVKLLLRYQISYTALTPIIKQLYVDVADKEFPIEGKKQTESRLSLLTGIHRKEIKRLRADEFEENEVPESVSLGGQMVAFWLSTRGYHKKGIPNPIPRQSTKPEDVSFETLVETVGHQDIRPRAVLDEWLRLGMVEINEEDKVVLKEEAFIPQQDFDEKLFYWQRNLKDHLATASHNLSAENDEARLERSVYYGDLSQEAVNELHELYKKESMKVLKKMNEKALQLKSKKPGDLNMNAGVYFSFDESDRSEEG